MRTTSLSQSARQLVRTIAGQKLYLLLARIYGHSASLWSAGPLLYLRLRRLQRNSTHRLPEQVKLPQFSHPIYARAGTSDPFVLQDVLIRYLYNCYEPKRSPSLIIDAGANVGYSSLFFLNKFPHAHLVALEPDSANCQVAKLNLAPYERRVDLLQLGMWPERAFLKVSGDSAYALHVSVVPPGSAYDCEGIDPMSLLRQIGQSRISIFKCDIEGSEVVLFQGDYLEWLGVTDCLMIELHTKEAEEMICPMVLAEGFSHYRYRELHIFTRP